MDAAVHAGGFFQVVLRPHRWAFGTRIQPIAAYAPQTNIEGPIHTACWNQGESAKKINDSSMCYASTNSKVKHLHVEPLSTISAIRPKVTQGHQKVKQPARSWKDMKHRWVLCIHWFMKHMHKRCTRNKMLSLHTGAEISKTIEKPNRPLPNHGSSSFGGSGKFWSVKYGNRWVERFAFVCNPWCCWYLYTTSKNADYDKVNNFDNQFQCSIFVVLWALSCYLH
jgi:hypothetical protein